MTDQWHRDLDQPDLPHPDLRHVRAADLTGDTAQTGGMDRREAISGTTVGSRSIWMGQTHVGPGVSSGDHHHGATETAIHVLRGHPVFVFARAGSSEGEDEVRLETSPGDYVFVPPFTPHREENPGADEAVVIIARGSQQGVVVNLPSLWPQEG